MLRPGVLSATPFSNHSPADRAGAARQPEVNTHVAPLPPGSGPLLAASARRAEEKLRGKGGGSRGKEVAARTRGIIFHDVTQLASTAESQKAIDCGQYVFVNISPTQLSH